jgi:hypothetical protein
MRWLISLGMVLAGLLAACDEQDRQRGSGETAGGTGSTAADSLANQVYSIAGFKLGQSAGEVRGLLARKGIAIDEDHAPNVGIGMLTSADSGYFTFINSRLISYWPPPAPLESQGEFDGKAGEFAQRYGPPQSDKAQVPKGYGVSEALLAGSAEVRFWYDAESRQLLIMGYDRGTQQVWLELTSNTDELIGQVLGKLNGAKDKAGDGESSQGSGEE